MGALSIPLHLTILFSNDILLIIIFMICLSIFSKYQPFDGILIIGTLVLFETISIAVTGVRILSEWGFTVLS